MPYPYVSNEGSFGQGFLDAFSQFYGISSNRKRQKEQDKIAEADRTRQQEERDAELALQGIMRGTAPTEEAPAPLGEQFRQAAVAPPSVRRPMGPPTLDEATAMEMQDSAGLEHMPPPRLPGAFDPNTGTFTPAIPRYRQLNRGFYVDETMTPEGRTRAKTQAERAAKVQRYVSAGLSPRDAEIAADDETYGREKLTASTEPPRNIDPLSPEGIAAAVERAKAIKAAEGGGGPDPVEIQRQFMRENQLASGYAQAVKQNREAYEKVATGLQSAPEAKAGNGAAQVAVLYAFISGLDPGTAVKEGEIDLARQAAGLWSYAISMAEKVANKQAVVPRQTIEQMEEFMRRKASLIEESVEEQRQHYIGRAGRFAIPDPDMLFLGVGGNRKSPAATPPVPPGSTPPNPWR